MGDDDLDLVHVGHHLGDDPQRHRVYLGRGSEIAPDRALWPISLGPVPLAVRLLLPSQSASICTRAASRVTGSAEPVSEKVSVSCYFLDRNGDFGGFADRELSVGSDSVADRVHLGGNQAERLDELGVRDGCRSSHGLRCPVRGERLIT
jgi:hypothetical protein